MIKLEISDFLGFCDLNGIEAVQGDRVQQLESYIRECQESARNGEELVADAIYDKLMDILRKVNPESELCKYIWEDSTEDLDDTDSIIKNNPMYSIMTVKSYDCDELKSFVSRLPDNSPFSAHVSVKLNGHGIRLKFKYGDFFNARSRARSSAGRDITKQLLTILEDANLSHIADISDLPLVEIRGEWVMPLENLNTARTYNKDIKSAFTAVSSMGRDSASVDEWKLLRFVAYEFLADGVSFSTKEEEYDYLVSLGFETPLGWVIEDLSKDTLVEELKVIVPECEEEVVNAVGYSYYTDGLVFAINDTDFFRKLGDDGSHYKFGNMALKVGYWQQDMYYGYIQTILWMKGKTKLSPVAIVSNNKDDIEFNDFGEHPFVMSKSEISNYNDLGVSTNSGNKVRRIPLYEPNNLLILDAYKGNILHFRYGGEAGVVPCFDDGKTLVEGKARELISGYDYEYED